MAVPKAVERYERNIRLQEVGPEGQERLFESRVLVIGTGGLGSAALLYLASAGIGSLEIVDGDQLEPSNLNRQVIHSADALGKPKVDSAAERIRSLNPDCEVLRHYTRLTAENAESLIRGGRRGVDLVLDCTDNFPARFQIADTARRQGLPLVSAAVQHFAGQVFTQSPEPDSPCYRCLIPNPPAEGEVPAPADVGVLGSVVGVLGSLQATEAVKMLLGIGERLTHHLLSYDALSNRCRLLDRYRDPHCPLCGNQSD